MSNSALTDTQGGTIASRDGLTSGGGGWTRRAWLAGTTRSAALGLVERAFRKRPAIDARTIARMAAHAERVDPTPLFALAQRAVDAARSSGASYADARLTRTVQHSYGMIGDGSFDGDEELLGIGVRVLVNGCWGFAASAEWIPDDIVQLASDAVEQARANAIGMTRPVELVHAPATTGSWTTPVKIDPFTIPIEENLDHIVYWKARAAEIGAPFSGNGMGSRFGFARQERILATSQGTLTAQTRYEIGGSMELQLATSQEPGSTINVRGIEMAGKGWEIFHEAQLPEQFTQLADELRHQRKLMRPKALDVGRYAVVCDGPTMAAILDQTLGLGTQLDRALGYEANASGTSFLNDPLAMVGSFQVASSLVTVTANRSAPGQLATVKWDEEGVEPADTTLLKDGVLTDFQTTREQASWLAQYYAKAGRPVRSNGCAVAEDALSITLQQMPNLAMTPNISDVTVDALIASVKDGLFLEQGGASCDFQGRNGLLTGNFREIKNGRLGAPMTDGAVLFNTVDLWKHVTAVGDATTVKGFSISQYDYFGILDMKGEPEQRASHSVRAPAALVMNQTIINPARKS